MKKLIYNIIAILIISVMLQGCSSKDDIVDNTNLSNTSETNITENNITKENELTLSLKDFVGTYYGINENTENSSMFIAQSGDDYILTIIHGNTDSKVLKDSNMKNYKDYGQDDEWDCLEYNDNADCVYHFRKRSGDDQLYVTISQNEFVQIFTNK